MAVNEGARHGQMSTGPAADDDLGDLDLPPGDPIGQSMPPGADDASGPHAGTVDTDEDEYQIYGDDDEIEEDDGDPDEAQ